MTTRIRRYEDGDWDAVVDLCLLAFAAGCGALEARSATGLDWGACLEEYLRRSLVGSREEEAPLVASRPGSWSASSTTRSTASPGAGGSA
ncbi:MAG: hypothetical protein U0599_01100 [Vicinamibacteria bacterium]